MKARDPTQYRQAWQHHIDQTASLALAADIDYVEWCHIKATLETWLDYAHRRLIDMESEHE